MTFVRILLAALLLPPLGLSETPQILVSAPEMRDPELARSVILILYSGDHGTIGIVVNRVTKVAASELFRDLRAPRCGSQPVYAGGPVRVGINALVRAAAKPRGSSLLFGNVYLIGDRTPLNKLLEACPADAPVRVYIGSCGWGRGQLEAELRRGDWRTLPARADLVFDRDPASLWARLIAHTK